MVLTFVRGLFILMSTAVAVLYAKQTFASAASLLVATFTALAVSSLLIAADVLTPRKKLSAISGVFVGLIVGMIVAYALSFLVDFTVDAVATVQPSLPTVDVALLRKGIKVFLGVVCVFGAITLVLQTKDEFRFLIPYVEFTKETRGPRPMLVDTSAIIDGRIADLADTGLIQGSIVIPRFVLDELQRIADASDRLKRARGRRGLEVVRRLQSGPMAEGRVEAVGPERGAVDHRLIEAAQAMRAKLVTTDFNLVKVAHVRGVEVVNVNALADALRPPVLPGEALTVRIVKPGESAGQGVGYLEDGTMVVVEQGRDRIGQDTQLTVTSMIQTSAGRMLFGRAYDGQRGQGDPEGRPASA